MKNTKQKVSIQGLNTDNLNSQASNEGKNNTPGCGRKNYNELHGKSITIENEIQHVGLNRKFKLCPSCLLTLLGCVIQREDIPPYSMGAWHQPQMLRLDAFWYLQWVSWPALHGQRNRGSISND